MALGFARKNKGLRPQKRMKERSHEKNEGIQNRTRLPGNSNDLHQWRNNKKKNKARRSGNSNDLHQWRVVATWESHLRDVEHADFLESHLVEASLKFSVAYIVGHHVSKQLPQTL